MAARGPIPCGPCSELDPGESGLNPDLYGMPRRQLAVNPARRKAFATNGVGQTVVARQPQDDRPVDAVAGRRPVAAVDVADETRVRIAPAEHRVVRAHHG